MDRTQTVTLTNIDFLDMLKVFLDDNLSEFYYYFQDGKWQKTLK